MDPALSLMLLEPEDDAGLLACAEALADVRPEVAAMLRQAVSLPRDDRAELLDRARRAWADAEAPLHAEPTFHSLPASLRQEFHSHHRSLVAELEALALGLDADESASLGPLRRLAHTLKGEAGIVGLDGLVARWHDVESVLDDADLTARARAERLLAAVTATEADLAALAAGYLPATGEAPPSAAPITAPPPPATAVEPPPMLVVESPARAPAPAVSQPTVRDEETIAILGDFLLEAMDGVSQADEILMRAEQGDAEAGDLDAIFRAFHSMKGVAAALEVEPVAVLAHAMEDLLSRCRDGSLPFGGDVVAVLLDGTQTLRGLLDDTRACIERNLTFTMPDRAQEILVRLRARLSASASRLDAPSGDRPQPVKAPDAPQPVPLRPTAPPEPTVEVAPSMAMPTWLAEAARMVEALPDVAVTGASAAATARSAAHRSEPPSVVALPTPPASETPASARIRETVKVDLERVDLLVELIGELVIAESMVAGRSESSASPGLRNALRHLTKIVRDLQRMGIGLRMVPLVGVFQKMRRLVRDLCVKVGKEAVLVTHGDGIEMDRSLVEQVADPLVHILRNAMDHGLEAPQERRSAGKPPQGTIVLSASHEAGNIVIEVRDDGRGMDRDRILARAVERGLVPADAVLTDAEVFELIFAPGFSTAERVTEVSGRGVGMDVVKRNVEAMGGRVRVSSVRGHGSTVRLTVPLTLAIIDGMLIGCGTERFVVPTRSIVESIRATPQMLVTYAGRHEVVDVRGELHPLVRLHQALDVRPTATHLADGLLLIVDGITRRFAIFVDEVVSRQQVVIKAMDGRLVDTRHYSGACILADGHAGLILNIDALLDVGETRDPIGGAA